MSPGAFFTIILFACILGDVCPDVISSSASESLLSIARTPCQVPYSKHYYFLSSQEERLNPYDNIDGSGKVTVNVKCFSPTKVIEPDDFAVCFNGHWFPSQHTCVQSKCPPVEDAFSTLYTCTSSKGIEERCVQPADPGTKMTMQCSHWRYAFTDGTRYRETSCLEHGDWKAWDRCGTVCGLELNSNTPGSYNHFILNDYFWLAVIFHFENGEWNQVCVGTVTSNFVIITSHNCFHGEEWTSKEPLRIGVGNYSRNYRDYASTSIYNVGLINWNVPRTIVLLTVDRYIAMSDTVGNACIGGHFTIDTRIGHIAVQRKIDNRTVLNGAYALPWSGNKECKFSKMTSEEIRSDEYCSLANNHTFVPTDIGAGLILINDGRYYVFGVLSALLLDGRIPVFLNITTELNVKFIEETFEESDQWVINKNENWATRREGDSYL